MRLLAIGVAVFIASCSAAARPRIEWIQRAESMDSARTRAFTDGVSWDFAKGPVPTEMILPPTPAPPSMLGTFVEATFVIDPRGSIQHILISEPADREFGRRMADHFRQFRFRPAVRDDGTPTRGNYTFRWGFPR